MHLKKIISPLLISLLMAGIGNPAFAQDGATLYVEKTCASCHGADGKTPSLPSYPKIAGQNADYMFNQLKDIKYKKRTNRITAAMIGILQNVNEEEMRVIVDWVATLPYK
jgi:cytochrome c